MFCCDITLFFFLRCYFNATLRSYRFHSDFVIFFNGIRFFNPRLDSTILNLITLHTHNTVYFTVFQARSTRVNAGQRTRVLCESAQYRIVYVPETIDTHTHTMWLIKSRVAVGAAARRQKHNTRFWLMWNFLGRLRWRCNYTHTVMCVYIYTLRGGPRACHGPFT